MVPEHYERLASVIERQLLAFPEHGKFLRKRFSTSDESELIFADQIAGLICRISGSELTQMCEDYKWISHAMVEEELYFRRHNKYRLSTFAEAYAQIYDNSAYMARYMRGLLATQLWWSNHTRVLKYFRDEYLPANPAGFSHLEVGPGHGLLLWLAINAEGVGSVAGWDVSDASITLTRGALDAMGVPPERIVLRNVDISSPPKETFQSITFSEVLEHLENPLAALKGLRDLLTPGGRLFVHAPVNSPAPDHLYLFRTPEEVRDMVIEAGLEVEDTLFEPCTGVTLERARKMEVTISAVVVARKP